MTDALHALRTHSVVQTLSEAFAAAGEDLYLVGGSVRDSLSDRPDFADLDFTTPARPDRIRNIVEHLGTIWDAGERFGTLGVSVRGVKVEVTTFRTEVYTEESRKPTVAFGDRIEEDLLRRDLTINAMAVHLASSSGVEARLVDPFGGASDLAAGILRTPDDPLKTMDEDPLRQIRVVRFAVKRGMEVHPLLAEAIRTTAHRLGIVSVERITEELRKILALGGPALAEAVRLATSLGVAGHLLGRLLPPPEAVAVLEELEGDLLAALVFLTGAEEPALRALKLSNLEASRALRVARLAGTLTEADILGVRRAVREAAEDEVTAARSILAAAHRSESPALADALRLAPSLRQPLPLTGEDVLQRGLRGRAVGEALNRVLEAFLLDPNLTREEALDTVQV